MEIEIRDNIKKLRERFGYSQLELSKITGLTVNYISAMERGVKPPGRRAVKVLCEAFAVDELTLRFGERQSPEDYMQGNMFDRMAWEAWQLLPASAKQKLLPLIIAEVPPDQAGPEVPKRGGGIRQKSE